MTRLARPGRTAVPVHDPAFQALKERVIGRTGHHYYTDKDAQLWERVAARMEARGLDDVGAYLALLDGAGDGEWAQLESAVTINETFFFRFAEQFDVLRRRLLPRLLEQAGEARRLRIWCAGCSTGAEPYSLAVLLDDLLGAGLADWRISITGTDIDAGALEVASAARYTSWTLRTLGAAERARLFDQDGSSYRLKPRYRGLVRFERHNMMSLIEGPAPLQFSDYDLILCRNVLIYFRQDIATRLVAALTERLAPGGYLLVGHAEASPDFASVATPVEVDGILTYRRRDAVPTESPAPAPPAAPPALRRRSAPAPTAAQRDRRPVRPAAAVAPPIPERSGGSALEALRTALARGETEQALRLAEEETGRDGQDPVPHYLAALGALALGDAARAERGFRKTLYLDNSFVMAHYMLGRHLIAGGRDAEGRRALANAMRGAAALDPAAALPEGDGMTAEGLIAAVRSALA